VRNFTLYNGPLFDEIHQSYSDWLVQTIRLYKNSTNIEFDWQVGPIDVDDQVGKEVIFKLKTDIKSDKIFYTDSNGREIMKRVRNARHNSSDFPLSEKVAGNYFPINSRIFIKDKSRQLTLITDRSQGASSLTDGTIEVMCHRRMLHDDGFGVDENLNELGADQKGLIVKGKFNLVFNDTESSARLHRKLAHEISMRPQVFFSISDYDYSQLNNWTAANANKLPKNVNLLSLMKDFDSIDQDDCLLVRLEHFYEYNEDNEYSEPVQVDLQDLFNGTFTIVSLEELSLGANMNVEGLINRLKWNGENDKSVPKREEQNSKNSYQSPFIISLNPMQIRTFRIKYNREK
jgi:lysosomal alpha-mannosidase